MRLVKYVNIFFALILLSLWSVPTQAADPLGIVPFLKPPKENSEEVVYSSGNNYIVGQEIIEKRQENSKTYYLGNGKYSIIASQSPIHYKDNYSSSLEQWKDIDLTIVNGKIDKAPYILVIDYDNLSINMQDKRTGDTVNLKLTGIPPGQLKKVTPYISKGKVEFNEVLSGLDLQIVAENGWVAFKRVIKNSTVPHKATFDISQNGNMGLKVSYRAKDGKTRVVPIQVDSSIVDGVLTEEVSAFRVTDIVYPLEIDPTIDVKVGASTDDCAFYYNNSLSSWAIDLTGAGVWFGTGAGYFSTDVYKKGMGMRFLNITIPNSSTIDTAHITFTASANKSNTTVNSRLIGDDEDNAATWSTVANYQSRRGTVVGGADDTKITTAVVDWDGIAAWTTDTTYDSPEIKTIVQEIINRVGWASGNAMALWWDDHDNRSTNAVDTQRLAYQYDVSTTKCPELHIEYTIPSDPYPSTTTDAATSVEETTATLNGDVTDITSGTMRGFAWGTTSNSTLPVNETPPASYTSNYTEVGSISAGAFSHGLTSLTSADRYYYRAYSANATGYGWGGEESFLTKPNEPTVFTCSANATAVDLSWTTASAGAGTTMHTVIKYKAGSYPADVTDGTLSYNGTLSSYQQTGLIDGTTYYFRAWSWCYDGALSQYSDSYGSCYAVPVTQMVLTRPNTGFSQDWAIVNGYLQLGVYTATQTGFDYGLTTAYGNSKVSAVGTYSTGLFTSTLTSLDKATVYHYRAKALIGGVWKYGDDMSFATKGSPAIYEYWNTGGDTDSQRIGSANVTYQTFTTNTTTIPHSVTTVKLSLKRVGIPGTITASLRNTSNCTAGVTCYCYPTGADLTSGTLDGASISTGYTWYIFTMATETCLSANTTYAIVVSCADCDSTNYVMWQADASGGYGGGNAGYSNDSGVTWTAQCTPDQLFEVWGNPCISVEDAKVITSYIEDGDWLICILYKNLYPPYYADAEDVSSYFSLQLADGTTVLAQTKCPEWGYKPGCIYLAADEVTGLQWGYAYRVRLYGNFTGNPYAEYSLQSSDWLGSDLTRLDSWVRSTASLMETYYNTDLTTYVAEQGICLNSTGGVIFSNNIPELEVIRPDLFSITSTNVQIEDENFTHTYQESLVWQQALGPQLSLALNNLGSTVGVGGSTAGAIIGFIIYALVALFAFRPGHAIAAIVIPLPILLIIFGTGLAELALMAILLAVAVVLFVRTLWFAGG